MIVGESQCLPHQFNPPTTPDSARSGDARESEDSKSSMIITRLGCIGWSKTSQKDMDSGKEEERERGCERERKIGRVGKEDAKKDVQAMKRHAKRQSGLMDSKASNDSTDQVTTYYFGINCRNIIIAGINTYYYFNMFISMLHLHTSSSLSSSFARPSPELLPSLEFLVYFSLDLQAHFNPISV